MNLRINIWHIYFLLKIIYMFCALFIFVNFTTLGDTEQYLNSEPFKFRWTTNSTEHIEFLGGTLSFFFGKIFANIPFIFLSFYGVYYPIKKLNLDQKQLIIILTLLSFPTFGIWTSIVSKESVAVFYMGLILGFIIDLIKRNPRKNYLFLFIGLFLCWIFKFQYLVGIFFVIIYIYLNNILRFKNEKNLFLFILIISASLILIYILRNEINDLAFEIPKHFSTDSFGTRTNFTWENKNDIFWKAPYGMVLGFIGPTLDEAISKKTYLMAYIESLTILIIFFFASMNLFRISLVTHKFNIYYFGIFFIILHWILFVHYPMGVLNPGSAIRYRQGFFSFFVILFYFMYIDISEKIFDKKK